MSFVVVPQDVNLLNEARTNEMVIIPKGFLQIRYTETEAILLTVRNME